MRAAFSTTRMPRSLAVFCLLLALGAPAVAQTVPAPAPRTGPSVGLILEGALEYGGDRVAEFLFTDGGTQSMRAGQGGSVATGLELRPHAASRFALRGTVGLKYVTTAADNANITLTRIPFEVIGSVDLVRGARVGAGLVHHARIRFEGDGFLPDLAFDGATGATVEAGWRYVALTYTWLRYRDAYDNRYNAGSPGVALTYVLPLTGR